MPYQPFCYTHKDLYDKNGAGIADLVLPREKKPFRVPQLFKEGGPK